MAYITKLDQNQCNMVPITRSAYVMPISGSALSYIGLFQGLLQASSCIGLVTGPPVGGLLFSNGGFYLPFLVTGSVFMFFGLISVFVLRPATQANPSSRDGCHEIIRLLRRPLVIVVGYMVLIGQATLGFTDVTLAEYLDEIKPGISKVYVGLIFLIPAGLVVMLSPLIGIVTDRYKRLSRPVMIIGCFLGAVGFLLIGPAPFVAFLPKASTRLVIISLAVSALGWSCLALTYQEFIIAARALGFPDDLETQGIISGVNGAFSSLGAFLGPTVGGVLYEKLQFPWASTVFACAITLSGVLLTVYIITEFLYGKLNAVSGTKEQTVINDECSPLLSRRHVIT